MISSGYSAEAWGLKPEAYVGDVDWGEPYRANLTGWILAAAPGSVLDVGCLDGRLIRRLRGLGYGGSYLGIDITPAFIDVARLRSPGEAFEVGDARSLRSGLRSDVVVLANVIMHLDDPWAAMREACAAATQRVLVSTYAHYGKVDVEEPGAGFLNHWFARGEVLAHVPRGWRFVRESLFRPTWAQEEWKRVMQVELKPTESRP